MTYCPSCRSASASPGAACPRCGFDVPGTAAPGLVYEAMQQQPAARSVTAQGAPINGLALVSVVLGAAGLFFCVFFGPLILVTGTAGVIYGHKARKAIRASGGSQRGGGLAIAGLVLSYAGIAFAILSILAIGAITLFGDELREMLGSKVDAVGNEHP
jgi:hypothetical protein